MTSRARDERGSVLVVMGLTIPVLLLFAVLAIEIGGWYVHKRALQNRADAAALAAGAAYANRFPTCGDGTSAGDALENEITDEANRFGGKPGTPGAVNTTLNKQTNVTVTINGVDGIGPCHPHATDPDGISPPNSYWADVKVTETSVGGLVGGLVGVGARNLSARARVELQQVATTTRQRPFVLANPGAVSCVSASYSNVLNNPLDLTTGSGTWTGTKAEGLTTDDSTVDVSLGCSAPDTYQGMAYVTLIPNVTGVDRLTNLTLTPSGSCTNNNPYFIPYDGVACTITVTAGAAFADPLFREVRVRTGATIDPLDQGIVMTPDLSGNFTADVTVSPESGRASDGMYEIEILAKSGPPGTQDATPIGHTLVQAGTEDQQGPIADVVLENHAVDPGTALGTITVSLRGLATGALKSISGGADCGTGTLQANFAVGCAGPFTVKGALPCASSSPLDCVGGILNGNLGTIAGDYDTMWAPGGACTTNHYPATTTSPGDPRLITVFVTDSVPRTQNPGQTYPILGFASFYVTGWDGAPASCAGENQSRPRGATVPAGGRVWGHYLEFGTNSATSTPRSAACTGAAGELCVAALVR